MTTQKAVAFEAMMRCAEYNLSKRNFLESLELCNKALELQPNDKTCLVARSKCYLKLGDPQAALQDAEAALTEDKSYNKGLYQKAEALYSMGDFEYALMYYHRGHKLRPELNEFRLGIQKAQEAIDNSIGSAAKIKLENKGDLSFFAKPDDLGNKKRGYVKPATIKGKPSTSSRNKELRSSQSSRKTVKQLLGELYADKEYLEKLIQDENLMQDRSSNPIYELAQGGLNYLETRTEFWRQQKPLYARKKEPHRQKSQRSKKTSEKANIAKYIVQQLEDIDQALVSGHPDKSLTLAQNTLKAVEGMSIHEVPNKSDVVGNLYSCIGNAYVELDMLDKALRSHKKDLEICNKNHLKDGKSRALDNVGRVYARLGKYQKAVDCWSQKISMLKSPLESTWLYHEIGRCHLELGNNVEARDFGQKSLASGEEADDEVWQLNASVLIAQAQVKLGAVSEAVVSFRNALDFAVQLNDEAAQKAIAKALSDLSSRQDGGELNDDLKARDGFSSSAMLKGNAGRHSDSDTSRGSDSELDEAAHALRDLPEDVEKSGPAYSESEDSHHSSDHKYSSNPERTSPHGSDQEVTPRELQTQTSRAMDNVVSKQPSWRETDTEEETKRDTSDASGRSEQADASYTEDDTKRETTESYKAESYSSPPKQADHEDEELRTDNDATPIASDEEDVSHERASDDDSVMKSGQEPAKSSGDEFAEGSTAADIDVKVAEADHKELSDADDFYGDS